MKQLITMTIKLGLCVVLSNPHITMPDTNGYRIIDGLLLSTRLVSIDACRDTDGTYVEQLTLRARYTNNSSAPLKIIIDNQPPAEMFVGRSIADLRHKKYEYDGTTFYMPSETAQIPTFDSTPTLSPGSSRGFDTSLTLFVRPPYIPRQPGTIISGTYFLQLLMLTSAYEEGQQQDQKTPQLVTISTVSAPMKFSTPIEEGLRNCPVLPNIDWTMFSALLHLYLS